MGHRKNFGPKKNVIHLQPKRINSYPFILEKIETKSSFFQENFTYPPKEGISIIEKRINYCCTKKSLLQKPTVVANIHKLKKISLQKQTI
jgi:hypothetical protein